MISHIPNLLSISRLLLGVLFFYINNVYLSCCIFIIAVFSDFFDGWIARKYNCESFLGMILDPIADKVLIIMGVIKLYNQGSVDWYIPCLILFREILVTFGAIIIYIKFRAHKEYNLHVMRPVLFGKINAVICFMWLSNICLRNVGLDYPTLHNLLTWLLIFANVVSLRSYYKKFIQLCIYNKLN